VLPLPDLADCSGITATDSLSAFGWQCEVQGTPRLVSTSLQSGKNLSDLIDFDLVAWRVMTVQVNKDGAPLRTSAATAWWDNTVADAPTTYAAGGDNYILLPDSTTIYLVRTALSRKYTVGAGNGFVVKPGITLSHDDSRPEGNSGFTLFLDSSFNWVEGAFAGLHVNPIGSNGAFSMFRNLTVDLGAHFSSSKSLIDTVASSGPIYLTNGNGNTIFNVVVQHAAGSGFVLYNSNNDSVSSLTIYYSSNPGLWLGGTSTGAHLSFVSLIQNQGGVLVDATASGNHIDTLDDDETGAGAGTDGITLSGHGNSFSRVTVRHSARHGINVSGDDNTIATTSISSPSGTGIFVTGNNDRLVQVTVTGAGGEGITAGPSTVVLDATVGNSLNHALVAGSADTLLAGLCAANFAGDGLDATGSPTVYDFVAASGGNLTYAHTTSFHGLMKMGGLTSGCVIDSNPSPCPTTGGDLTVHTGISVTGTFVGKVSSVANLSSGLGLDGGTFPSADQRGPCTSSCRAWDWSAKLGEDGDGSAPVLLGVLGTPAAAITHRWVAADAGACAALQVAAPSWNAGSSQCTSQLLAHAVEIVGDGLGNENGLCESNEVCLFTPNIGSYQGHGSLTVGPSVGAIGGVSSVVLQQYSQNGY
jgi:hypothetical protein